MNHLSKHLPARKLAKYFEDVETLELHRWYWVPSMKLHSKSSIWVPVLDVPHTDEGLNILHYNLDTRFLTRRQFKDFIGSHSQTVILASEKPELRPYRYVRQKTAAPYFYENALYGLFEKTACDNHLKMTGMKCPHRGVDLSKCNPIDGVVTCPAHGLRWDIKTGDLVKNIRFDKQEIAPIE